VRGGKNGDREKEKEREREREERRGRREPSENGEVNGTDAPKGYDGTRRRGIVWEECIAPDARIHRNTVQDYVTIGEMDTSFYPSTGREGGPIKSLKPATRQFAETNPRRGAVGPPKNCLPINSVLASWRNELALVTRLLRINTETVLRDCIALEETSSSVKIKIAILPISKRDLTRTLTVKSPNSRKIPPRDRTELLS